MQSLKNKQPVIRKIRELETLPVNKLELDNNVPVYCFYNDDVKALKIDFLFPAGRAFQHKHFLSMFTNAFLREASGKYIEEKLDYYGIFINQKPETYWSVFSFYLPVMYLEKLMPIIKKMLFEPDFNDEDTLNFIKEKTRQNIIKNNTKTNFRASVKLKNLLWGNNNPLGFMPEEKHINNVGLEDIKDFFRNNYLNNFNIIISGYYPESIRNTLNNHFGELNNNPILPSLNLSSAKKGQETAHIPMKNKSQYSVFWGIKTINPGNNDYFEFRILNTLYGGFFGSRLMRKIREEKAYTYGIFTSLHPSAAGTMMSLSADIGKDYYDDTVKQIENEAVKLRSEQITDNELKLLKNYMNGELLSIFDGAFKHASVYRYLIEMNLDMDYYSAYLKTVQEITAEKIRETAEKYLEIEKFKRVTAG